MVGLNAILFVAQVSCERAELARLLEQNQFAVTFGDTCEQALELLRSSFFDLIILDLLLVKDRHFEHCKALHEVVSIPVMLITAGGDDEEMIAGIETAAEDFITRPIRSAEFLARVRTILKRTTSPLALPYWMLQYEDLLLDLRSRRVLRNGQAMPLTRTEIRLLSYFMHHVGETISKVDLLKTVWNYEDELGGYNLVESAIKRLRSTIEDDPKNPRYIFTVWGEGYRFGK